jgi:hypothetical protein
MKCTNADCNSTATKIVAWEMTGRARAVFVAPYCDTHAEEVQRIQGGKFACGPALSDEAREIEGIR